MNATDVVIVLIMVASWVHGWFTGSTHEIKKYLKRNTPSD